MFLKKVIKYTKRLEDPKNPLLGPTLKGLYLFGLWQTGGKFRTVVYNLIHLTTFFFVTSQFVDLYFVRHDINKVLNNMSLTVLSVICLAKCFSYVFWQSEWRKLAQSISEEELKEIKNGDPIILKHMEGYTKYTRIITYMFWTMVLITNFLLILTPLLKYVSSHSYREEIRMGTEPLPQILCSWFPFDNERMPGYLISVIVHIIMGSQGSGVLAVYDMNAVAIMSYLKGQMIILREKCNSLFDDVTSTQDVLDRIKECHRHHNVLLKHSSVFNSLLSPTMFVYVLMCSITICGSVVQFSSKEATASQKLWVFQYTSGLISQLFLYCWHSNEVTLHSKLVDRGIYSSDWWKSNVRVRKQLLLLAGKLNHPLILDAGPYTTLSIPTFIEIMKGSYSFFTLFSQMQEN
ncbi:odorant receptor 82a [Spodoptera frugiperda]|uniref:Odorant receptor n=1 Tax=Spodoptera frugiperda TaxID=7108 RepID=A0A9R0ERC5_SPOFR|nr:odorant receptor 82a [Spodoptera frugiperda]WCF43311.1 odorant receptor OR53 [Spodoptera frugiperda]